MKLNLKTFTINTILYRAWVILQDWILLGLAGWAFNLYSVGFGALLAIAWNIINTGTYWLWHYVFFKHFGISKKGFTYWFTGPPGSGKSYAARIKRVKLEAGGHTVIHLDGDVVREGLSKDLGFSEEDRTTHLHRVGHVCKLLNDQGVDVVASFVSPYEFIRAWLKERIPNFKLIYVDTPHAICYSRRKKLYDNAHVGRYEIPITPDKIIRGC